MPRSSRFIIPVALTILFTLPAVVWATDKPKHPPKPVIPPPVVLPTPDRCAADSWSIKCADKRAHLTAGVFLGLAASGLAQDRPKWQQFALGMAPLTAKEIFDDQPGGTGFSWKDMTYNAIGVASGVYLGGWFISRQGSTTVVGFAREF